MNKIMCHVNYSHLTLSDLALCFEYYIADIHTIMAQSDTKMTTYVSKSLLSRMSDTHLVHLCYYLTILIYLCLENNS